jgi:hypothetical protein
MAYHYTATLAVGGPGITVTVALSVTSVLTLNAGFTVTLLPPLRTLIPKRGVGYAARVGNPQIPQEVRGLTE